jgi:class 3 adenylate cyclase
MIPSHKNYILSTNPEIGWVRRLMLFSFCFGFHHAYSQQPAIGLAARIDSLLLAYETSTDDLSDKISLAEKAFQLSGQLGDTCRQVHARVLQAGSLDGIGLADSAMQQLLWAQRFFKATCDSNILLLLYGNLTAVYLTLEHHDAVDSITRAGRALYSSRWMNPASKFNIELNYGISKVVREDTIGGEAIFHALLTEATSLHHNHYEQQALINLGTIKAITGNLDSAYYFFELASRMSRLANNVRTYLDLQHNLANIDIDRGRYKQAAIRLDSLYLTAERTNNLPSMATTQYVRSRLYQEQGDFTRAFTYLTAYVELNTKVLNEQRLRAVTEMEEKYQSEKKAGEIKQLQIANLDANLRNERIRHTRNRMIYIGAGILLFAIGLWTRLRLVHRSRRAIQKEKDISEGLLLNILPAAVADELKTKGAAEAKLYEKATILFSDFKSFTIIAGELSAAELVSEINVCFKAFDEIMAEFGLEKIKTIGDAYMAAGSVPDDNKAEALHVIHAALAMQDFIKARKKERDAQNQVGFEMRVGIHTGPVVAGIVGIKKFQYDLWGDTVNIASRMETNSEPGEVNISEATYSFVKDNPAFQFYGDVFCATCQ